MPKTYSEATTVENIAGNLIGSYHAELATARILYIFVSEASKKGGRPVLGKARKLSGFLEWRLEKDFILEVAEDTWAELDGAQRTALVDSLLETLTGEADEKTGNMIWGTREPDVKEFTTILTRYGAWNDQLAEFVSVAKTVNLEGFQEESELDLGDESELVTSAEV